MKLRQLIAIPALWRYMVPLLLCMAPAALANAPDGAAAINVASRIAALAPSLTELVYAAGAGDKLVAVSAFSDYPNAARALPQVADYSGINIEALLSLKPDLVLVWGSGTQEKQIQRLAALGIRTERIGIETLADISVALRRIGELAGTRPLAERAAQSATERTRSLAAQFQARSVVSVFVEVGRSPLLTVNDRHFISELVRLCGGKNIFADATTLVFQPSREQLLIKQPDVILFGESRTSNPGQTRNNDVYTGLDASRRGDLLGINADHLLRPGPRLLDAADEVCRKMDAVRTRRWR